MSEYVDEMLGQYGYPPDGDESLPEDYADCSDEELRRLTSQARDAKIVSIRNWPHPLSIKQRYCLCRWLADHDNKHAFQ